MVWPGLSAREAVWLVPLAAAFTLAPVASGCPEAVEPTEPATADWAAALADAGLAAGGTSGALGTAADTLPPAWAATAGTAGGGTTGTGTWAVACAAALPAWAGARVASVPSAETNTAVWMNFFMGYSLG